MNSETITSLTDGAVRLSHTGADGFIFFAIVVVAVVFGFAVWIAYKAIKKLMDSHDENAQRIDEAHDRIHFLEERESNCMKQVEKVTKELQQCIEDLKK